MYRLGFQLFLTLQAFDEISLLLPMEILYRQVARRAWRHIFSYPQRSPSKPDAIKSFMMNDLLCL